MSHERVERNAGVSGRIDASGSEFDEPAFEFCDAADLEAADTTAAACALTDSGVPGVSLLVPST